MQKTPTHSTPERLTRSVSPQKISKNSEKNLQDTTSTPSETNKSPLLPVEEESIPKKSKTPPPNLSIFRGGGVVSYLLSPFSYP